MAKTKRAATSGMAKHLRELGLAKYPGVHLKSPWPGHLDLAVKDKTFAYLSPDGEPFSISCKLPESNAVALMLPNTQPTGYGLGKSGWVSASYAEGEELPPAEIFEAWIDESYRAQAPKRLVKELETRGRAEAAKPKAAPRKKRAKAPASKKAPSRRRA